MLNFVSNSFRQKQIQGLQNKWSIKRMSQIMYFFLLNKLHLTRSCNFTINSSCTSKVLKYQISLFSSRSESTHCYFNKCTNLSGPASSAHSINMVSKFRLYQVDHNMNFHVVPNLTLTFLYKFVNCTKHLIF